MRNLQYKIRICQKSHNTVTITVYVWTMVRILMKQTLSTNFEVTNSDFSIKCVRFFAIVKDRIETKSKFLEKISENSSFVVSELVVGSSEQVIHSEKWS